MRFREQKRLLSEEIYLRLLVYLWRSNAKQHFENTERVRDGFMFHLGFGSLLHTDCEL